MPVRNVVDQESNQTMDGSKTLVNPLLRGATCDADPIAPLGVVTKQYADGISNRLNVFMNANLQIWNRGTLFSSLADGAFTADRIKYNKSGVGVNRISKSTGGPSVALSGVLFNTALEIDCTTIDASIGAGDYYYISHRIEGYRYRQLGQRVMTFSFWVFSIKVGTYCVSFRNAGGGAPDRSYVAEFTVNQSAVWERKTITVTAPSSAGTWNFAAGVGLEISIALAAGSTFQTAPNTWAVGNFLATSNQVNGMDNVANAMVFTGFRLEDGSSAGPIQIRPYDDDYQDCERYLLMSFPEAVAPAQNAGLAGSTRITSDIAGAVAFTGYIQFRRRMRTGGTGTLYNPSAANALIRNVTDSADFSASAIAEVSENGMTLTGTASAGTAVGEQLAVHWMVTSEP